MEINMDFWPYEFSVYSILYGKTKHMLLTLAPGELPFWNILTVPPDDVLAPLVDGPALWNTGLVAGLPMVNVESELVAICMMLPCRDMTWDILGIEGSLLPPPSPSSTLKSPAFMPVSWKPAEAIMCERFMWSFSNVTFGKLRLHTVQLCL